MNLFHLPKYGLNENRPENKCHDGEYSKINKSYFKAMKNI